MGAECSDKVRHGPVGEVDFKFSCSYRNPRDVRSTVLTGIQTRGVSFTVVLSFYSILTLLQSTISDREKERLAKHVG